MFKRFEKSDVSTVTLLKSSAQRNIRKQIVEQYPASESSIDTILPAGKIEEAKLPHKTTIACIDKEPLAFHAKGEPYVPTLRVVHKYPGLMPRVTVDKGAIRFVLNGANVKAPGLTSEGGSVEIDEPAGTPVAVYAEGKASAIAVGTLAMDAKDIKPGVMGDAIKVLHYLNDGLWKLDKLA